MTNGSLMKVESIAECSEHSDTLLTCIKRLENQLVAVLHRFYCTSFQDIISLIYLTYETNKRDKTALDCSPQFGSFMV